MNQPNSTLRALDQLDELNDEETQISEDFCDTWFLSDCQVPPKRTSALSGRAAISKDDARNHGEALRGHGRFAERIGESRPPYDSSLQL